MAKPFIHIDASKAIREANKAYASVSGSLRRRATATALNVVARKARTAASKEIRSIYKIRAKDIGKATVISRAHQNNLEAAVIATGRPLPIMAFNPRFSKKGVTVNIMGKRKRFAHAFKATMKSGHVGVFVRGQYKAGKLVSRPKRVRPPRDNDNPITEVRTVGIPTAMSNDVVMRHLMQKIEAELPKELSRAFNYFAGKT
jgi:hypothetical protein